MNTNCTYLWQCIENASRACGDRGLILASKWAGEQLMDFDIDDSIILDCLDASSSYSSALLTFNRDNIPSKEYASILLAQSLITSGEYLRCAHILRRQKGQAGGDGPAMRSNGDGNESHGSSSIKVTSKLGIFLAGYSLYMAGERLKEQYTVENKGSEQQAADSMTNNGNNARGKGNAQFLGGKSLPDGMKKNNGNPFLGDLFLDLYPLYEDGDMDGFLLYIFGIVLRDLKRQGGGSLNLRLLISNSRSSCPADNHVNQSHEKLPTAYECLLRSLQAYPFNWSCWRDFSDLCINENITPPAWKVFYKGVKRYYSPSISSDIMSEGSAGNENDLSADVEGVAVDLSMDSFEMAYWIMYHHFLCHHYLEQQNGERALNIIDTLQHYMDILAANTDGIDSPGSSHYTSDGNNTSRNTITTYRALAAYASRDYDNAQQYFEDARFSDPHRLEHVDTYSNILYVKEKRAELSHLAHMVTKINKFAPETCCVIGNYYSLKGLHERAIIYFQRALRVNDKFLSAWTLMGHECVELRNVHAAVQCYRKAVDVSSSDYRAWYGLGQTYEMLHSYQYSLYYYKKAAALKPLDARMWSAVGSCLIRLNAKRDAMQAFERAVSCGDSEGVATRELARLYRDDGEMELAANCYLRQLTDAGYSLGGDQRRADLEGPRAAERARVDSLDEVFGGEDANRSKDITSINTTFDATSNGNDANASLLNSSISVDLGDAILDSATVHNSLGAIALDAELVEGVLFLAQYYKDCREFKKAQQCCAHLLDFVGPEGDEARAIVRDIRQQEISLREMQHTAAEQGVGSIGRIYEEEGMHLDASTATSTSIGATRFRSRTTGRLNQGAQEAPATYRRSNRVRHRETGNDEVR